MSVLFQAAVTATINSPTDDTIAINDTSNYSASTEPGNLLASFDTYRKIVVTDKNKKTFTFSAQAGGDAVITPGNAVSNPTNYSVKSGDSIYRIKLLTLPTWKGLVTWDFSIFPPGSAKYLYLVIDSVNTEIETDPGLPLSEIVDFLNSGLFGDLGVFSTSGTTISVLGNHQYGSFTVQDIGHSVIATYPAVQVFLYSNINQVYYNGIVYNSLQNDNSCNQPDISPSWWAPITEDQVSPKYYALVNIARTHDLELCKIRVTQMAACNIKVCDSLCDNKYYNKATKIFMLLSAIENDVTYGNWDDADCLIGIGSQICNCNC